MLQKVRFLILLFFVLFFSTGIFAQRIDVDSLKRSALSQMSAGRYGEAIDQLNKYISAVPQEAEAYNLRGVCFEKRQEYPNARIDYRRAVALETNPTKRSQYEDNLRRLTETWYTILNKRIEGRMREIAINPNNAYNYLEIGKSYYFMENWAKAEQWYDEYLNRDDNASADEIIRYSEVLAKTGNITKGEQVLKKYVERYPNDWRLLSRYGYFTMWLSKYAISKNAFETALKIKPFFKEAQDGLDMVNNQTYVNQVSPREFEKEYPIDRDYRLLRKKPDDIETRFKLVDELIKANRIEEAYEQLKIIAVTNADDPRYEEKWDYVTEYRLRVYNEQLALARAKLESDPTDKESLKKVAQYYEYLTEYDSAMTVMDQYFKAYPDDKDPDLRFRWAKVCAWNRAFDRAINITDDLLQDYPDNLEYQLFRAQVSVWINRDIELARTYLGNVLKADSNNVQALVAMGSIKLLDRDYPAAQTYADKAKAIDPTNDDVVKLQSNIDWQKLRAEEEKLYAILEEGRKHVVDGDCENAIPYYEDYLTQAEPNVLTLKEYGDVLFCAKDYKKALTTYNDVLAQGPNYGAQMQRAKLYYAMGDSLDAAHEFKDLVEQDSTDFEANLYLADSFAKLGENDSARTIYKNLIETWQLDSTQTAMVKQRIGWLPITSLTDVLETFPNYMGLAPSIQYYGDNLSFRFQNFSSRAEFGLTNFLTLGFSFGKTYLHSDIRSLDADIVSSYFYTGTASFTIFKGNIILRLSRNLNLGAGVGSSNANGLSQRFDKDAFVRYEKRDTISLGFTYQKSDAALILFSPYLIDIRHYSSLYKIDGYYVHRDGLKLAGSYQYVTVTDANEGNDLFLRIGKYFYKDLSIGYEYNYSNYKYDSKYYYSPINFESHCLWIENDLEKRDAQRISIGGKFGVIPTQKFIVLEGHVEVYYQFLKNLLITGRLAAGSTSRDYASYRYFSGQLSAYWTIF